MDEVLTELLIYSTIYISRISHRPNISELFTNYNNTSALTIGHYEVYRITMLKLIKSLTIIYTNIHMYICHIYYRYNIYVIYDDLYM